MLLYINDYRYTCTIEGVSHHLQQWPLVNMLINIVYFELSERQVFWGGQLQHCLGHLQDNNRRSITSLGIGFYWIGIMYLIPWVCLCWVSEGCICRLRESLGDSLWQIKICFIFVPCCSQWKEYQTICRELLLNNKLTFVIIWTYWILSQECGRQLHIILDSPNNTACINENLSTPWRSTPTMAIQGIVVM